MSRVRNPNFSSLVEPAVTRSSIYETPSSELNVKTKDLVGRKLATASKLLNYNNSNPKKTNNKENYSQEPKTTSMSIYNKILSLDEKQASRKANISPVDLSRIVVQASSKKLSTLNGQSGPKTQKKAKTQKENLMPENVSAFQNFLKKNLKQKDNNNRQIRCMTEESSIIRKTYASEPRNLYNFNSGEQRNRSVGEEGSNKSKYMCSFLRTNMERIEEETSHRKDEIYNFLEKIQQNQKILLNIENNISEKKKSLNENLKAILEGYDSFTSKVIKALQEYTESCMLKLNAQFFEEVEKYNAAEKLAVNFTNEFKKIKDDIDINFNQIINNMEQKPYQTIMDEYNCKLAEFQEKKASLEHFNVNTQNSLAAPNELKTFKENMCKVLEDLMSKNEQDFMKVNLENRISSPTMGIKSMETVGPHKKSFPKEINTAPDSGILAAKYLNLPQDSSRSKVHRLLFSNLKSTPRLNFELYEPPHELTTDFNEHEENNNYGRINVPARDSYDFQTTLKEIDMNRNSVESNQNFIQYLHPPHK